MIKLDPVSTALVLIDLQVVILSYPLIPVIGPLLLARGRELAGRFRDAGATVALVDVAGATDGADALYQTADEPSHHPHGGCPSGWSALGNGLPAGGDILVTKRQWGVFHGTELDLQLRRRGIKTIVLGGVATYMGVESTARQAWELGYELMIVSDATTSLVIEPHEMSMRHLFPRISRLVTSAGIGF